MAVALRLGLTGLLAVANGCALGHERAGRDAGPGDATVHLDTSLDLDAPFPHDASVDVDAPDVLPNDASNDAFSASDAWVDAPAAWRPLEPQAPTLEWVDDTLPWLFWTGDRVTLAHRWIYGLASLHHYDANGTRAGSVDLSVTRASVTLSDILGIDYDGDRYGIVADDRAPFDSMLPGAGWFWPDGHQTEASTSLPFDEHPFELVSLGPSRGWATLALRADALNLPDQPPGPIDLIVYDEAMRPVRTTELFATGVRASIGRNQSTILAVYRDGSSEDRCEARSIGGDGAPGVPIEFACGAFSLGQPSAHGHELIVASTSVHGSIWLSTLDVDRSAVTASSILHTATDTDLVGYVAVAGDPTGRRLAVAFVTMSPDYAYTAWLLELDPTSLEPLGSPLELASTTSPQRIEGMTALFTDSVLFVAWTRAGGRSETMMQLFRRPAGT